MIKVLKEIFSRPLYVLLATSTAAIVFMAAVWLPNLRLLWEVWSLSQITLFQKVSFAFNLAGSIQTNFTVISASYTILISLLFGINIACFVYYFKQRGLSWRGTETSLGLGGLVIGAFGIGCAACGTFILTSLLSLFGATAFLTLLPFGGQEFGFLGVGLLALSTYLILKQLKEPVVCQVV